MQKAMQYTVIIKPNGKVHVVVNDRGEVPCERAEDVANSLGDVQETEILPDTSYVERHIDLGEDE